MQHAIDGIAEAVENDVLSKYPSYKLIFDGTENYYVSKYYADNGYGKPADIKNVIAYDAFGTQDPKQRIPSQSVYIRFTGITFLNGAIADTWVSSSARTLIEPPTDWVPMSNNCGDGLKAVCLSDSQWKDKVDACVAKFCYPQDYWSPQSLIGDLIREGITGIIGYISEPGVAADLQLPAYLNGEFNLAETFWYSPAGNPHIIIGDPKIRLKNKQAKISSLAVYIDKIKNDLYNSPLWWLIRSCYR